MEKHFDVMSTFIVLVYAYDFRGISFSDFFITFPGHFFFIVTEV